jgi:hypothetical protein
MMINTYTPKTQRILGRVLALVLLLALTLRLDGQTGTQAEAKAGGLSVQAEHVSQASIGTAFSYQGRLDDGGNPANGMYDFQFRLYDSPSGTNQVGSVDIKEGVEVIDGLVSVQLDFGPVFDGTALYLEIAVKPTGGGGVYDVLDPRQPLSPVPYALHAASIADGTVTSSKIGEPCDYGQVLANAGGTWSCADAEVSFGTQREISHTVEISGTVMVGIVADFSSLNITTEILEVHPQPELTYKVPGYTHYANFYLICTQPCAFLDDWYDDVVAASKVGGTVSHGTVDIIIFDGLGEEAQRWSGEYCWPSQVAAELSSDGGTLFSRYLMACDTLDLVLP